MNVTKLASAVCGRRLTAARGVCAPSVARATVDASRSCVRGASSMWARHAAASAARVAPAPRATLIFSRAMSTSGADEVVESQDGPLLPTTRALRNVAVIAHVDHGTSVEALPGARGTRVLSCE